MVWHSEFYFFLFYIALGVVLHIESRGILSFARKNVFSASPRRPLLEKATFLISTACDHFLKFYSSFDASRRAEQLCRTLQAMKPEKIKAKFTKHDFEGRFWRTFGGLHCCFCFAGPETELERKSISRWSREKSQIYLKTISQGGKKAAREGYSRTGPTAFVSPSSLLVGFWRKNTAEKSHFGVFEVGKSFYGVKNR